MASSSVEKIYAPSVNSELTSKRILVVEDEPQLQKFLLDILRSDGYTSVQAAGNVREALILSGTWKPEAFLLDVMLPDGDGFELLETIRKTNQAPALFLSARDEDEARLQGLGLGADDYITKPFLPQELLLRLKAVLKRTYSQAHQSSDDPQYIAANSGQSSDHAHDVLSLGNAVIDFSTGTIHYADKSNREDISLTATETAILNVLRANRGIIVTTDSLIENVWGNSFGYENSLMVHMHRLRDKIEQDPAHPQWIITARGLGYRLATENRTEG